MKKGLDGSMGMSPRKLMAGGTEKGNFGVEGLNGHRHEGHRGGHPDEHMSHTPLEDHERGIGHGIHYSKDHHPAQAAPRHGPMHMGSHKGRYKE